jgi:DNA-binding IclR family transcriptional regulator
VLLAVLLTSARYGGREARLGVDDLARMTGLGMRTVSGALAGLMRSGLVRRVGRYERLTVHLGGVRPGKVQSSRHPPIERGLRREAQTCVRLRRADMSARRLLLYMFLFLTM